jgi:hypothetical protein
MKRFRKDKVLLCANVFIWLASLAALDSDSRLPLILWIGSGLWLTIYAWVNGHLHLGGVEYEDEDE